ncbi:MAG: hypothetical protein CMP98_06920 [Gammaproteobacteria bacterium]|nr:hypothetical protein [Gammaproteobacteria bacterium]OUU09668.1 MAG: hypothetical protein CBB94_07080 [Gammaproteobacteria bacterium TMED34]
MSGNSKLIPPLGNKRFALKLRMIAEFTSMLTSGMFERYPKLKCSVLEAGGNWISAWLNRMDHKFEVMAEAQCR